jgi:2-keto-4-pentenoate hydratase/2-oxohepta-3-ene-1,7-dioic acid hydratase in catechol pathway
MGTRQLSLTLLAALLTLGPGARAQGDSPYKLGTFSRGDRPFIGLVVNDDIVIDLAAANQAFEATQPGAPRVMLPDALKDLVAGFEADGVRTRLAALAAQAAASRQGAIPLESLKTLPPLIPTHLLNAARNYPEHAAEMAGRNAETPSATIPESIPGIWMRKPGDTRQNPYAFPKSVSAIIANGDAIELPPGRPNVDWECELSIVIGRVAHRVPVERARDYIFGYTIQNDVSDRGERGDGRYGSDWFIGKSHHTFAPLGPVIVPKAFLPDPQKLRVSFRLNGKVMQDSSTAGMTHNVDEMVSYVSHVVRLQPGDIIATGTPAGVGTARAEPVYMKDGDRAVCTISGIGTLENPVINAVVR